MDNSRNLIGYGKNDFKIVWPNNARIAIQIVLNYEEGAEISVLNGDRPTNSLPLFFKLTVFDTTVETFKRVLISSKYSFGYFIIYLIILLIKTQLLQSLSYPHIAFLILPSLFPYL